MIQPALAHDRLLADIRAAADDESRLHLWWLGQSGFLLQWQRRHVLLDPYLSDSLTRKYQATDKPHVRMTELVLEPDRLDFIDVITSSHNHTDHLDAETLSALMRANPTAPLLVPAANLEFAAQRLGVEPQHLQGIDAGESLNLAGCWWHAVPAAHEQVDRDARGRCLYLGYVVQLGPFTIYHSGDTIRYAEQVSAVGQWPIDIALLPINGRAPERRVAGNLWGSEAAELAQELSARWVIPCHYEMFEFNTATPVEFVTTCRRLGQEFAVLRCGERFTCEPALAAQ